VGDFARVIDGRGGDNKFVQRIPVPKSPHGVNVSPDGKYAICSGKLSPTCSVVDISKLDAVFAGKIKPRDAVVAEPEVGLGPLHTAFDGKGNAYTSIFIDSVMTKWNIEKAIQQFKGEDVDPILEKVDVHYQVGHTNASMSETKEADGKWLVALCKFSKDRFLPTGPLRSENDQLIDMTADKLKVVHDGTAYPEPHDAVIVMRDKIHPEKVDDRKGPAYALYAAWAKEDGVDLKKANKVIRKGPHQVRVYMTSQAPSYGMTEIRVKAGDTVQFVCTNIDNVEDLSHGFCLVQHDCNMVVNSNGTNSITVKVPKKGLFWYYCPWFCHALHLEMRGRLIAE
jgi:nitrous-oxide reductase